MQVVMREDFAVHTGATYGPSDWIVVDQSMIDRFAALCGDDQYIHVDPIRAADGPFGGTVAHGFLTMSLLSTMARQVMPRSAGARMGVNYGFDRLRFVAPVPAGSRVRGMFTLDTCDTSMPGELRLTWDVTVEVEGGAKPALVARWLTQQYLGGEHGAP